MKPNKTNALIFDLDGTLWDASDAVAESFNVKLSQLGLPERITGDMMRSQMGKTLEEIAVVFFSNYDRDKAVEIMRACTDYENEYITSHGGRLYPGVREMLEGVRKNGWFCACVSNCQSGYIEAFISFHQLDGLFDDIECWGNTGNFKDDNIRTVIKRNGIEKAVYAGDTMGDCKSAISAGCEFIHCAYGYGAIEGLTVPEASAPADILSIAKGLLGD